MNSVKFYIDVVVLIRGISEYRDAEITLFPVAPDKSKVAHADGHVTGEQLEIEYIYKKMMADLGLFDEFQVWYQNNVNTAATTPYYPSWKLNVSTYAEQFFAEQHPRIRTFVCPMELGLNMELVFRN